MLAARHILNRLAASPALRLNLIRHDVPPRDSDWYARCRIQHFARFPWIVGDGVRGLFALWLMQAGRDAIVGAILAALIAVLIGSLALRRTLERPLANAQRHLVQIRTFLLFRAVVWAVISNPAVDSVRSST